MTRTMPVANTFSVSSTPLKALVIGRTTVAATHLFAPRLLARLFRTKLDGNAEVYARMFAIRNAALAIGLANLRQFASPKQFLQVNVIIDAVDAGAFLLAGGRREIDTPVAVFGTTVALSATVLGMAALRSHPSA